MRYVWKILAFIVAVLIGLMLATVATAQKAYAASCTTVWLTAPTVDHVLSAGTKRCLNLNDSIYDGALIRVYRLDNPDLRQIDWVDRWAITTYPANNGRNESTAKLIRWIASQHGVRVDFANRDLLGRLGCSGGFANSVTGTYMPSPRYPGDGLTRIGTGFTDRCMSDRSTAVNTAKFEFSRALIERTCGTVAPPIAGNEYLEIAKVTAAYSIKYLNAGMNDGGVKPSASDYWRATQIRNGNCGS